VQRVNRASVRVSGEVVGRIDEPGLLVLVGATHTDTTEIAASLATKIWQLRILEGEVSCADNSAPILVVSQFTLFADLSKGRRPSWSKAAPAAVSEPLVEAFTSALSALGARVQTGRFGAAMEVELVNHGPLTILIDTDD
jgi:D-aminoacyl-tRNA deacylase